MIKKIFLKIGALFTTMTICMTTVAITAKSIKVEAAEFRSSKEIVSDMGVGWNLGNSLDSLATWLGSEASAEQYESSWGNPVTTKAMIDKIKASGFKTIRIPVSWGQHMGTAPNYTVDSKWMSRVQEVVDYCIDNGLYVILNVHHDSEWCVPTYVKQSEVTPKLTNLWTQIAENFKSYGDHLIFEALNEPRLIGTQYEWTGGTAESRDVVNKYNEVALKAIRNTGGNNKVRSVMVPTYAASGMDLTINDMVVPKDNNVIVSLHAYSPYNFAMNENGTSTWGTSEDKADLDKEFDRYYNKFVANGTPVIIGEFGSINKNNTDSRKELAAYFVAAAKKRGMACIWWDNNSITANKGETFGLFNRDKLTWHFPEIQKAMIDSYNAIKVNNNEASNTDKGDNESSNNSSNNTNNNSSNTYLKDGAIYYIKNVHSSLYLDVENGLDINGTNVQQYTSNKLSAQKFKAVYIGDGYYKFVSQVGEANKVLDVSGYSSDDGQNIIIYQDNGSINQQFKLISLGSGKYEIATRISEDKSRLEVKGSSKSSKANVQQWQDTSKKGQEWIFELA